MKISKKLITIIGGGIFSVLNSEHCSESHAAKQSLCTYTPGAASRLGRCAFVCLSLCALSALFYSCQPSTTEEELEANTRVAEADSAQSSGTSFTITIDDNAFKDTIYYEF